jgi:hypothetical protein
MRQYLLCERVLQETFEAVPEPATRALYDRLRLEPETVLLQKEDLATARKDRTHRGVLP